MSDTFTKYIHIHVYLYCRLYYFQGTKNRNNNKYVWRYTICFLIMTIFSCPWMNYEVKNVPDVTAIWTKGGDGHNHVFDSKNF